MVLVDDKPAVESPDCGEDVGRGGSLRRLNQAVGRTLTIVVVRAAVGYAHVDAQKQKPAVRFVHHERIPVPPKQPLLLDTRHTTHDTRHTTHDTRHTTHDTRHEEVSGVFVPDQLLAGGGQ
jgi:hypothetical protein